MANAMEDLKVNEMLLTGEPEDVQKKTFTGTIRISFIIYIYIHIYIFIYVYVDVCIYIVMF